MRQDFFRIYYFLGELFSFNFLFKNFTRVSFHFAYFNSRKPIVTPIFDRYSDFHSIVSIVSDILHIRAYVTKSLLNDVNLNKCCMTQDYLFKREKRYILEKQNSSLRVLTNNTQCGENRASSEIGT